MNLFMRTKIPLLILLALVIKFSLFAYTSLVVPEAKIESDSYGYLLVAETLAEHGVFARPLEEGRFIPETFRTPGYPVFLAFFHHLLRIPLAGIVFLQILLSIAAAYFTYRIALRIHPKAALFSGLLVLLDPPTTVFSLMIMTEALFLFFFTGFMAVMDVYLRDRRMKFLLGACLLLVLCTYIRPVTYYLGAATALFLVGTAGQGRWKQAAKAAVIFYLVFYGLVGIWQWRNYKQARTSEFSTIVMATLDPSMGTGLVPSLQKYTAEKNPSLGQQAVFVIGGATRSMMSLMTDPGTLKYFGSRPLRTAGKVFAYPFMIFWLAGFLAGLLTILREWRNNRTMIFFLFVIGYFAAITVGGTFLGASARFRVPLMPLIAIISAQGWLTLTAFLKK